jgi:hypothetical protein
MKPGVSHSASNFRRMPMLTRLEESNEEIFAKRKKTKR